MLLVDNCRILLLVGPLICVSGNAPAQGGDTYCFIGGSTDTGKCDGDQVCGVMQADVTIVGCVEKDTCGPIAPTDDTVVCNAGATHCCCRSVGWPCNRKSNACQAKELNKLPECAGVPLDPPGGPTNGGPANGGPANGGPASGSGTSKDTGIATTFTPPPIGTLILLIAVGASLRLDKVCS